MASDTPSPTEPASVHLQAKVQRAQHDLCAQLKTIESALRQGQLQRSVVLLNDLIVRARQMFVDEEALASGTGPTDDDGERVAYRALAERAGRLKTRCLNTPANTDLRHAIENELVALMGDLQNSDERFAPQTDTVAPNTPK